MEPILSLRASMSELQAGRMLRSWRAGMFRALRAERLRAVAAVYVPYCLHRVEITNNGRGEERLLAIDSVEGSLDLYGFPSIPGEEELVVVSTRNCLPSILNEAGGRNLLVERVRRMCFRQGFYRVRDLRITISAALIKLHVPYWVGFYGPDNDLSAVALNAMRRTIEGRRLTSVLREWLVSPDRSSPMPVAVPLFD